MKAEVTAHYQTYLQQMQTDYDYILKKMKREKEELELAEREVRDDRAEECREQERQHSESRKYAR